MRLRRTLAVLICVCFVKGCSEGNDIEVTTAYGPGLKLDGIGERYTWLSPKEMPHGDAWLDNPSLHAHVRRDLTAGLAQRGFVESGDQDPDFWLAYGVARRRVNDASVYAHGVTYKKGSIHLRVIDPETSKIIWHGVAGARIDPARPAEERTRRISMAVKKLLASFPSP
jgi:hypothetical protein